MCARADFLQLLPHHESLPIIIVQVKDLTLTQRYINNVKAIQPFDWVALFFGVYIVSLKVACELKDIELSHYTLDHLGERITPGWRKGLRIVGFLRRWAFLPSLLTTALAVVAVDGADAKSVCLNAVAILFVLGARSSFVLPQS